MIIEFECHSNLSCVVTIDGQDHIIGARQSKRFEFNGDRIAFSCAPNCDSYVSSFFGFISIYHTFSTKTDYIIHTKDHEFLRVILQETTTKGAHADKYIWIKTTCAQEEVQVESCCVRDEAAMRAKMAAVQKREDKAELVAKICLILQDVLLIVVVYAFLFFGAWVLSDLRTAALITIPVYAVGLIIAFALQAAYKKRRKSLVVETANPFKDKSSNFESEYIRFVIRQSELLILSHKKRR